MPEAQRAPRRGCFSSLAALRRLVLAEIARIAPKKSPNKVLSGFSPQYFLPAFAPLVLSKSAIKTRPNKETNITPAVSPSKPHLPPLLT